MTAELVLWPPYACNTHIPTCVHTHTHFWRPVNLRLYKILRVCQSVADREEAFLADKTFNYWVCKTFNESQPRAKESDFCSCSGLQSTKQDVYSQSQTNSCGLEWKPVEIAIISSYGTLEKSRGTMHHPERIGKLTCDFHVLWLHRVVSMDRYHSAQAY